MNALARDLNYPALRKNKNIDAFLNRCKNYNLFFDCVCVDEDKILILSLKYISNLPVGAHELLSRDDEKAWLSWQENLSPSATDHMLLTVHNIQLFPLEKVTDEIRNKWINTSVVFRWNVDIQTAIWPWHIVKPKYLLSLNRCNFAVLQTLCSHSNFLHCILV